MKSIMTILIVSVLVSCNYRTPSKIRFSKNMDIEIPNDIKILKDEYQDMMQDYAIIYEFKMNEKSCKDLSMSIRKSAYYNSNILLNGAFEKEMFIDTLGKKAVWAKSKIGYSFCNDWERDVYSAEIDTIRMIARFNESHD
jgi:hypothetical protein